MKRRRWIRTLAIALGFGVFAFSAWRIAQPLLAKRGHAETVLRFSHWQLEPGVREAFDQLSREYESLHPGVRVQPIAIPARIYRQWTTSQLIGGEAPDLVQIGLGIGAQHYGFFQPITAEADAPNPYNAGTALAGLPWRNTFLDGMRAGFDPETRECYGASLFNVRVRVFCNLDLLKKITGSETLPADFAALQKLSQQVEAYAQRTGERIDPIAGSSQTGLIMLDDLLRTQLQRLCSRLGTATGLPPTTEDMYIARLQNQWSLQDPAFQSGARLMQDASRFLTPAFAQIENDQAFLRFAQGHAVMHMAYSLMATNILEQCPFRIGIIRNPLPTPEDPRYGHQMLASAAEASESSYGAFGLTRTSRHPELALDFLRFLTCRTSSVTFTTISKNLPTLVDVAPPLTLQGFAADTSGYPPTPSFLGWGETRAVMLNHQYLLFGPEGSVERYLAAVEPEFVQAIRTDLTRTVATRRDSVRRTDLSLAAAQELLKHDATNATLLRKFDSQQETQNEMEATAYYHELVLARSSSAPLSSHY